MLKMPPITFEFDVVGIFILVITFLQGILSRSYNFRDKYKDQINAICIKIKGLLTEKMEIYRFLSNPGNGSSEVDKEGKEQTLESILNDINYLSNEYYDWNHICTNISKKLRTSFLIGILMIILSLVFFIKTSNKNTSDLLLIFKSLSVMIIFYLSLFIIPILYKAYYSLPNKIEKKYQEMRDGDVRSWMRV